jgi:hypothetical protein
LASEAELLVPICSAHFSLSQFSKSLLLLSAFAAAFAKSSANEAAGLLL